MKFYFLLIAVVLLGLWIRLLTIFVFGEMIHEHDPQFNFRVAKIIHKYGLDFYKNWNDDLAWYPKGRIVFKTTYSGMMYLTNLI